MIWLLILILISGSVVNNSYHPETAQEIANELTEETRVKIGWLVKSRMWSCVIDYSHEEYSAWTTYRLISLAGRTIRDVDFDIEGVAVLFSNLTAYYKKVDGVWYFALLGRED